jgi:hypothetical protein
MTAECAEKYIADGLATQDEINQLLEELRKMARNSNAIMGYTRTIQIRAMKISN